MSLTVNVSGNLWPLKLIFSFGNGEKLHRSEWWEVAQVWLVRSCTGPNGEKLHRSKSGEDGEWSCCYQFFFVMSRNTVMVQSKHHSKVQVFSDKQLAHICINTANISLLLLYLLGHHRCWNHWHITLYNCWLFFFCSWKQHLFGYSVNVMFGALREHMLSLCMLLGRNFKCPC